jgi:hypothetical protein
MIFSNYSIFWSLLLELVNIDLKEIIIFYCLNYFSKYINEFGIPKTLSRRQITQS